MPEADPLVVNVAEADAVTEPLAVDDTVADVLCVALGVDDPEVDDVAVTDTVALPDPETDPVAEPLAVGVAVALAAPLRVWVEVVLGVRLLVADVDGLTMAISGGEPPAAASANDEVTLVQLRRPEKVVSNFVSTVCVAVQMLVSDFLVPFTQAATSVMLLPVHITNIVTFVTKLTLTSVSRISGQSDAMSTGSSSSRGLGPPANCRSRRAPIAGSPAAWAPTPVTSGT